MLERETELIQQLIIESTINGRVATRLSEVMTARLPRGVKAFMTAAVMDLLEEDFKQSGRLAQISRGISPTVSGERSLLRSLAMEYVIQQDEYVKLVEDSVHFLENYLCRPQWTLCELVFERKQTVTFETLVKKFESVVDYAYFSMLLERHARRKGLAEIGVAQFKSLVSRIDEEVTKQHTPRELALMTKPIFDFLLFGDFALSRPIPLGAIILFFDDKKMQNVKQYIERICQVRSREQISMEELIGIVEDYYEVESTVKKDETSKAEHPADENRAEPDPAPMQQQTADETLSVEEPPGEPQLPAPEAISETPAGDEPVTRTDQPWSPPADDDVKHVVRADDLVAFAAERDAHKFASYLTFPERPPGNGREDPLPDLNEMLTPDQRDKFVKSIFANDGNACFIFLTSLNHARTWPEAQPFLLQLFEMNSLDMHSPDVVEFTDTMQARFYPELRKVE